MALKVISGASLGAEGDARLVREARARRRPDAAHRDRQRCSEVLSRAIEEQAAKGATKLSFNDLLAVAREVGVDADTLRRANRAVRAREHERPAEVNDAAERDAWIRPRRADRRRG